MKKDLEKFIYINGLFDLYGELLTDRQKKIVIDYYQNNLSLSEIAENELISRNAVYDALKKAEDVLINYENSIHLYEKRKACLEIIENMHNEKRINKKDYEKLKGAL